MEYIKILELAHLEALRQWSKAKDKLDVEPTNSIRIEREKRLWEQLQEIEKIMNEEMKS